MNIKDYADCADSFALIFFAPFASLRLCVEIICRSNNYEADVV